MILARDLHLAKRWYDLAAATDSKTYWVVAPILAKLWLQGTPAATQCAGVIPPVLLRCIRRLALPVCALHVGRRCGSSSNA